MLKRIFLITLIFLLPAAVRAQIVPESAAQVQFSYAPLVKQVAPAVVNIYTRRVVVQEISPFFNDPVFRHFFGQGLGVPQERVENALGSGVIVRPDGLVVTNAHVVREADEITVALPDGREFEARKALVDEPSDLALLRIESEGEALPYVELRPSESLEVGDLVLAIGNPFGVGQTVTSGIVSALARSSLDINDFDFFIQTDAAINPGNSGGPLVAMDGRVVGINTAIFSRSGGSLGIGFSIPAEMVASVIAAEEAGRGGEHGIIRPWLGITAQALTTDIADVLSLDTPQGVLIADLRKSSPARKAGIQVGDVVVSVNGKPVREPSEMRFRMATIPLGEEAVFEIMRKGKMRTVRVPAMAPPEDPPRNETLLRGSHPFEGATVANINPALSVEMGLREEEGVVVISVYGRSIAARLVRPGDVIVSVNDDEVNNVKDLKDELDDAREYWNLVLSRNGRERQIVIR